MNKGLRRIQPLVLALSLVGIPLLLYAHSTGPLPAHTGGFGEPNCTACHFSVLNSGPGSVTITAPAAYVGGQVYQITVRVADPQRTSPATSRWGFEMSARTLAGQQAGTLRPTNGNTRCATPQQIGTTPCQGAFNGIQYVTHTVAGTRSGTTLGVDFTFEWTAPATSAGPVVMHAAGNAANNNGNADIGDRIYTTSITIQPQPAGPTPSISANGVRNLATLNPNPPALAPGSLVRLTGSDLTNGSQNYAPQFDSNGKLPTTVGGASATLNGMAAPILVANPDLMVIQVPFELAGLTTASLVVTLDGQPSAPQNVPLGPAAPGIFTLKQTGSGPGMVLITDAGIVVAPPGTAPSFSSRPVRPGEKITIFCTGLGIVSPPVETGAPAGVSQTAPVTVMIDGLPAEVQSSGTVPGSVGLYRVEAIVPPGASLGENVSLVISVGGAQSNATTISVGQ